MGLLYSRMVFQPPRPPQYSVESEHELFWIWTASGSRIPVIYYDGGVARKPTPRNRSEQRTSASPVQELRRYSRPFWKVWPRKSTYVGQEAKVDPREVAALLDLSSRAAHGQKLQDTPLERGQGTSGGTADSRDEMEAGHVLDILNQVPQPRRERRGYPEEFFTILYSHGNAEDLASAGAYVQLLTTVLGCKAIAYDYTGYGLSLPAGVRPSEYRFYKDTYACYRYLINLGVPPERILLIGRSVGSGPTVELASRFPIGGVVLIAPLMSCLRVVYPDIRCTIPCLDMFPSIDRIHLIKAPVLIIHGMQDNVVSICHGRGLYERCKMKTEPLWLENASHNDIEVHYLSTVLQRIRVFSRYCAAFFAERNIERA
jgi:pimeloyl-ACP methyl ester carboxylesterase